MKGGGEDRLRLRLRMRGIKELRMKNEGGKNGGLEIMKSGEIRMGETG